MLVWKLASNAIGFDTSSFYLPKLNQFWMLIKYVTIYIYIYTHTYIYIYTVFYIQLRIAADTFMSRAAESNIK